MALYQRSPSKIWWVDLTLPDGSRHRESSKTSNKQLATAFHDSTKVALWREIQLGIKRDKSLDEAIKLFLKEKADRKSVKCYEEQLEWWRRELGSKTLLRDITQENIIKAITKKRDVEKSAPATCNRYLAALKAMLRLVATKHKWIELAIIPHFFFFDEPKGRVRWLKPAEIARLLAALPEHARALAVFALATGLRRSNVTGLRWEQIDMANRVVIIEGASMKNGCDLGLPLPEEAMVILRQQIGKHDQFVFTYSGKPMTRIGYHTWKNACEAAGLVDFKWHDLRHCWATMMLQGGTPLNALQALGAWETPSMVQRYAHHCAESLRGYTGVVDGVLSKITTQSPSHPTFQPNKFALGKAA
ncbi:tyrosine-type recombinase/integrase [Massilia sp. PWRC2]|uniref:tyrosine-type recombinase/integrase n=1 Tax=Massilia sp. PWRC2 TaxID=2804626 RepID=UPI003CF80530